MGSQEEPLPFQIADNTLGIGISDPFNLSEDEKIHEL
jgi:hypothetical protein